MPSPDYVEPEHGSAGAKKPSTPRRSPAVRRAHNATPARKVSGQKSGTPQSAPARTKSSSKKAEPNLLNDFLMGRPSVHRSRRRSLNVVQTEVKKSAVGKLLPPGGVKDRVKQWQKANVAAVAADTAEPSSEPEELFEDMDQESVTEEDRRRIKFRKAQAMKRDRRKSGDGVSPLLPGNVQRSPKKRVVSDDHWMTKKEVKAQPQGTRKIDEQTPAGSKLPKDFVKRTPHNPSLEKRIEDWAKRTSGGARVQTPPSGSKATSKIVSLIDENSLKTSELVSLDNGAQSPSLGDKGFSDDAMLEPGDSDKKGRAEGLGKGSNHALRRNTTCRRKSSPISENIPSTNVTSTTVADDDQSNSVPTPTRRSKSRKHKRRSHSPESLKDIPVGYSAFSVLDIPVGVDASAMKVAKPTRQPSFSAVPKVLKKVYAEGIKIVHDTVDPPRIGVNHPPSIESWLKGTTDPFIDYDSLVKAPIRAASAKMRSKSSEIKPHLEGLGEKQEESRDHPVHALKQDDKTVRGPFEQNNKAHLDTRALTEKDSDGGSKTMILGTGLKRSSATRNSPAPRSPKKIAPASENKPETLSDKKDNLSSLKVAELSSSIPGVHDKVPSSKGQNNTHGRKPSEPKNTTENEHDKKINRFHPAHNTQMVDGAVFDTSKPSGLYSSSQPDISSSGKHRLSTIASVESFDSSVPMSETSSNVSQTTATQTTVTQKTLSTVNTADTSCSSRTESSTSRQRGKPSGLKRRLTKHSDLISVLSLPDTSLSGRSRSIKSARSIRTTRSNLASATISDLLRELADDEVKYMRELKTLVDGVVPVLLTCVFSKSDSAIEAGLLSFPSDSTHNSALTKPIVDMGIALERLKNLHKRVPLHEPDMFANWACGAYRLYEEYIASWRMGFQDIIVNLAAASNERPAECQALSDEMPRNIDGDVLNENGERVDVAFLLKRPLVRIKYLAKALKGISTLKPSEEATKADNQFQNLVLKIGDRIKEEKARFEDQAASNTDTSRARDTRTLEPVEGTKIDQSRQVKAKDFFDFRLFHSNKQRIDCRVELLLRDKPHETFDSGDLLICEVDSVSRWLLFPPFELDRVSARLGDMAGQLVVMIRGIHDSHEWHELFTLTCLDEETADEWIQMLGSKPKPPSLSQAIVQAAPEFLLLPHSVSVENDSTSSNSSEKLASDDYDVPIGERRGKRDSRLSSGQDRYHDKDSLQSVLDRNHLPVKSGPIFSGSSVNDISDIMDRPGRPPGMTFKDTKAIKNRTGPEYILSEKLSRGKAKSEPGEAYPLSNGNLSRLEGLGDPRVTGSRLHSTAIPSSYDALNLGHHKEPSTSGKDGKLSISTSIEQNTEVEDKPPPPPPHRSSSPTALHKSKSPSTSRSNIKSRRFSSPLKHEYQPSNASGTSSASDESDSTDAQDSSDSSDEELEAVDSSSPTPDQTEIERRLSNHGSIYGLPEASLAPSNSASQAPYRGVPLEADVKTTKLVATISCWSPKGRWVDLCSEDCLIVVGPGLIEAFEMNSSYSTVGAANGTVVSSDSSDMSKDSDSRTKRPIIGMELTPIVPLRQSNALDIEIRSPPTTRSTAKCTHTVRFRSRTLQECSKLYAAIHTARMENPVYKKLEQERIVNSYGRGSFQDDAAGSRRRGWFGRSKSYRASTRAPSVTVSDSSMMSFSSAISRLRNMGGVGGFNIARSSVAISHKNPVSTSSGATSIYTGSTHSATSGITPPRTPTSPSIAMTGTSNIVSLGSSNLRIRLYLLETSSRWNEIGNASLTITHPPRGMRQASSLYHGVEKRIIVTKRNSTKRGLGKGGPATQSPQAEELEAPEVLLDVVLGGGCFSRIGVVGIAMNVWEDVVGDNGEIGTVGAVGGVSGRTRKWMFQCANAAESTWIFALVGGSIGR